MSDPANVSPPAKLAMPEVSHERPSPALLESVLALLICVNPKEMQGVLALLEPPHGAEKVARGCARSLTFYIGRLGAHNVALTRSEAGANTVGSISNTIHSMMEVVRPQAIINVGVAFGMDQSKQRLGSVIVATQHVDYSTIRNEPDGSITERGVRVEVGRTLLNTFRDVETRWSNDDIPLIFGPIASGQQLVDDPNVLQGLRQRFKATVAGEMEGTGLYTAAAHHGVEHIVVKGICDFADGHKNKLAQPQAAHNAALVVEAALADPHLFNRFPAPTSAAVRGSGAAPVIDCNTISGGTGNTIQGGACNTITGGARNTIGASVACRASEASQPQARARVSQASVNERHQLAVAIASNIDVSLGLLGVEQDQVRAVAHGTTNMQLATAAVRLMGNMSLEDVVTKLRERGFGHLV